MGEVYEARDRELGDRIALKTVSAAISLDAGAVSRFKAEAQLARKVTHRNVCRVFDFGVHVERRGNEDVPTLTPFLTMELIRGRALSDHLLGGQRFTNEEALAIARQIARGLEAAHEAGVLHRDLKSDNVLLLPASRDHFRVVLTDFGLAAAIMGDAGDPGPSRGGSINGTRAYLAPERLAGARATTASDVYSLGVVMYELVTGTLGGEGADPNRFSALPDSAPIAPLIRACLTAEPRQRPANSAEVLRALDDLEQALPVPTATAADAHRRKGPRRRTWWWAVSPVIASALAMSLLFHRDPGAATSRARAGSGYSLSEQVQTQVAGPPAPAPQPAVVATAAIPTAAPSKRLARRSPRMQRSRTAVAAARDLLQSAEEHLRSGSIEEACLLGHEAAQRAAEAPAVWEFLGRCLMRLGEPREARLCYRRFLALKPDDANALFIEAIIDEDEK